MPTGLSFQATRNSVDKRIDNKNAAPAKIAGRLVHAVSATVLVTILLAYIGVTAGTNYGHYTSWSFTLASVYMATDLFLRRYTSAVLGPLAYAVTQSVACMTAAMYVADSGIVREANREHNHAVVSFMNVVLHVVPAVAVSVLLVTSRRDINPPPRYMAKCVLLATAFSGSYFMTFSPRHQYEVLVSNTTIRIAVVLLHVAFSAAGAFAVGHLAKKKAA